MHIGEQRDDAFACIIRQPDDDVVQHRVGYVVLLVMCEKWTLRSWGGNVRVSAGGG
jgi:hypothetical protein